jgi:SAM-dependent methyltransferase
VLIAAETVRRVSENIWIDRSSALERKPGFELLVCPQGGQRLHREGQELVTPDGRQRYPIVRDIPRFVSSDNYVGSFSFEWNTHWGTQLDSHRGDTLTEDTLRLKTGLTPENVRGKLVLDAGLGSGRFSEVLAKWGARVVGIDLSYAVEAAQKNVGSHPNVMVCQADIGKLPFAPGTFDYIISIGVLHHTPDTKLYFHRLARLLKPGGEIAIWVYPSEGDYAKCRVWVPFTRRLPSRWFYSFCKVFVPWARCRGDHPFVRLTRQVFPLSWQQSGIENDILDTYDAYSPYYYDTRMPEEVEAWFREANLQNIRTLSFKTAVRGQRAAS